MFNFSNIIKILKNQEDLTTVKVYPSKETIADPYEKNKTISDYNPIPIQAIVTNVTPEAIAWKYYGQIATGSKQIICDKRYLNLLKIADKIQINDNYYKTYKDDEKGFQILERADYIVTILVRKNE